MALWWRPDTPYYPPTSRRPDAPTRNINVGVLQSQAMFDELRDTCRQLAADMGRRLFLAATTGRFPSYNELMPDDAHGTLTGFYSLSRGLGIVCGPILAGLAIDLTSDGVFSATHGFQAMWLVCAAGALGSVPLIRRVRRQVADHHRLEDL